MPSHSKILPGDVVYSKRHRRPIAIERVREAGFIGRPLASDSSNEHRTEMIVYPEDVTGVSMSFDNWRKSQGL